MTKHLTWLLLCFAGLLAAGCRDGSDSARTYPDRSKYAIIGIDISAHNGDIDFDRVAADGVEFVIIKATEGATFKDRKFVDNYRFARKAGLKVGAYHFFRFDTPGYMQGLNFAGSLRGRAIDLPVVIDIEEWTNSAGQPTHLIMNRLNEMIEYLENHGYRVMLYTNKNGYTRFLKGNFPGYPIWICSLVDEPTGTDWTIWQATHNGRIDGIAHPVDVNAFNGTPTDWSTWLTTRESTRQH